MRCLFIGSPGFIAAHSPAAGVSIRIYWQHMYSWTGLTARGSGLGYHARLKETL